MAWERMHGPLLKPIRKHLIVLLLARFKGMICDGCVIHTVVTSKKLSKIDA